MQSCKLVDILLKERAWALKWVQTPKTREERNQMARVPYYDIVGSLMYAMMGPRLEICYGVGFVSRYQSVVTH